MIQGKRKVTLTEQEFPPPQALLCLLLLEPSRYSRNRYYSLYAQQPSLRAVHRRACALRRLYTTLVRALRWGEAELQLEEREQGLGLCFRDPSVSLTRWVTLGALEVSLLRLLIERDGLREMAPQLLHRGPDDQMRVGLALGKWKEALAHAAGGS